MKRAILALADGTTFEGRSFGAAGEATGEVVFNTSMTGYQEILTDPSYVGQMVCMTYPEQGNYGVNARRRRVGPAARDRVHRAELRRGAVELPRGAEPRARTSRRHGIVGIAGIDTRRLTRHLRTAGAQMGVISTEGSAKALVDRARALPGMEGQDLATRISTDGAVRLDRDAAPTRGRTRSAPRGEAALPRRRVRLGPQARDAAAPRGAGLPDHRRPRRARPPPRRSRSSPTACSSRTAPGDPAAVVGARETVAALLGKVPVFGICLGHQILALARRRADLQAQVRPPRREPAGEGPRHGQGRHHRPEPRVRGRRRDARQARARHAPEPERRHGRGASRSSTRPRSASSTTPRRRPGPHDARALFGRFARLMEQRAMKLEELQERLLAWATADDAQGRAARRARATHFERYGEPHEEDRTLRGPA